MSDTGRYSPSSHVTPHEKQTKKEKKKKKIYALHLNILIAAIKKE